MKLIILNKISQIQKDKYNIFYHVCNLYLEEKWQDEEELTESRKQEEKQQDRGDGEKIMKGGAS